MKTILHFVIILACCLLSGCKKDGIYFKFVDPNGNTVESQMISEVFLVGDESVMIHLDQKTGDDLSRMSSIVASTDDLDQIEVWLFGKPVGSLRAVPQRTLQTIRFRIDPFEENIIILREAGVRISARPQQGNDRPLMDLFGE